MVYKQKILPPSCFLPTKNLLFKIKIKKNSERKLRIEAEIVKGIVESILMEVVESFVVSIKHLWVIDCNLWRRRLVFDF